MGRFDYPSPYWDSVGDPALDLIDRMLTVDVEKRISIDDCLEHPWTRNTCGPGASIDSTDGLTGALGNLDFTKRKIQRERTLLSAINNVRVSKVIELAQDASPVKVYEKNANGPPANGGSPSKAKSGAPKAKKEDTPSKNRDAEEFVQMGGKGDEALFGHEESNYAP